MLDRDRSRFAAATAASTESPLGAGALAGSTLGLPGPPDQMRNSIDAVADRDFALDYLYAVTVLYTHLSRIGEEIVLWSSGEFGFVRLPENAATGSSMMPQKLNPDVAELARGKAGTAIGRLTGLLATVKGLPLAYDRDLQEDKAPVFAARADTRLGLRALAALVAGLRSIASAWLRRRRTRSCSRPTRQRRSSRTACRSARRTSGSPQAFATGRSRRPAHPLRASPAADARAGRSPRGTRRGAFPVRHDFSEPPAFEHRIQTCELWLLRSSQNTRVT